MKKILLLAPLLALASFSFGQDVKKNGEIRLVYPAEINKPEEIEPESNFVEKRLDAREPIEEDEEYDVDTPLGQVREIVSSLRAQRKILERLESAFTTGTSDEDVKKILDAIDVLGEDVLNNKSNATDEIKPTIDSALAKLEEERLLLEDNILQITIDSEKHFSEERAAFETSIAQAVDLFNAQAEEFKRSSEAFDLQSLQELNRYLKIISALTGIMSAIIIGMITKFIYSLVVGTIEKRVAERTKLLKNESGNGIF